MKYMIRTQLRELREMCSQYQLHLKTVAGHSHTYDRLQVSVRVRRSDSILEDERYVYVRVYVTSSFFFHYPLRDAIESCGCVRGSPPTRETLMPIKSVGESAYARQADLIYGAC